MNSGTTSIARHAMTVCRFMEVIYGETSRERYKSGILLENLSRPTRRFRFDTWRSCADRVFWESAHGTEWPDEANYAQLPRDAQAGKWMIPC